VKSPVQVSLRGEERALSLISHLSDALIGAGWRAQRESAGADAGLDLSASRSGVHLAIEMKAIAEGRADRLIPLWSQAWLQIQRAAPKGQVPMAVVGAEHIAPKAAEALIAFIREFAPEASGGVMDLAGLRMFVGPHSEALNSGENLQPRRAPAAARGKLFSDLNQWMLKVLLAPELPEQMISAPRGRYAGASDLAAAAQVSVMHASRFIQLLRKEGYLDDGSRWLQLVRRESLLRRWQSSVASQPVIEQQWRVLLRGAAEDAPQRWLQQQPGCIALFAAAKELGLGHVDGVPPYVYSYGVAMPAENDIAGFAKSSPGKPVDLIVRRPSAAQSVARAAVMKAHGPVCDVLQVWLDVSDHPSRGQEQADLIWNRVLGPLCENSAR